MGHENGGWMNDDQRDATKDEALRKEAYDSVEPAHERIISKAKPIDAFRAILAWCDRSGEEPEGQCLHEIEQICRKQLGLELLQYDPCNPQCTICAGELRAQAAYDQSMSDLAASGGIVDAP